MLSINEKMIPILKTPYEFKDYVELDLSVSNKALELFDLSSSHSIQQYIDDVYTKTGTKIAYGGYLEKRAIYKRSTHFLKENPELERDIHLGVDFWSKENTPVIAPANSRVHSFKDNKGLGDYGPTIILEHVIEGIQLYTLYGHLSRASLNNLEVGQQINKGAVFAYLGNSEVNGNYAPHLHFQVILDMQDYFGDYPGVCSKATLTEHKKNGIDPTQFLNMNAF